MNFHVLTLFPDMIEAGLHTSVTGRALQNGYIPVSYTHLDVYKRQESVFYGIFVYDACITVIDLCLYVYLSNRKR